MKLKILAVVFAMVGAFGTAQAAEFDYAMQDATLKSEHNGHNQSRIRGYKTFADFCFNWFGGFDDGFFPWYNYDWILLPITARSYVSTVHGFQFNDYFFLGGGVEFGGYLGENTFTMPIFVDAKVNFTKTKVSPYLEPKVGSFVGGFYGFYCAGTAGLRIRLKERNAINVGLEFSFHHSWKRGYTGSYCGLGTKIGYEF